MNAASGQYSRPVLILRSLPQKQAAAMSISGIIPRSAARRVAHCWAWSVELSVVTQVKEQQSVRRLVPSVAPCGVVRTWTHNTRLMIVPMPNKRQNCKLMTGLIPHV